MASLPHFSIAPLNSVTACTKEPVCTLSLSNEGGYGIFFHRKSVPNMVGGFVEQGTVEGRKQPKKFQCSGRNAQRA